MIGQPFIETMTRDLRRFADVLLEPGLAPTTAGVRKAGSVNLAHVERALRDFSTLGRRLIEEATIENRLSRQAVRRTTPVPRRASASRAPWHHVWQDRRLLPTRWVATDPSPAPHPQALAYLAYLVDCLQGQVDHVAGRLTKHLEDAYAARSDHSPWAKREKRRLEQTGVRLRYCEAGLARLRRRLRTRAGHVPRPRARPPRPALTGPTWRLLRSLAPRMIDPSVALPEWLGAILDPGMEATELSFLYQRWCGLKIVETLAELGFRVRGQAAGPLFLGEQAIEFCDASGVPLTLWCEPRLLCDVPHDSGIRAHGHREQQPDFLLLAPGERGLDAYVLDATLSSDRERLLAKGAYLTTLVFDAMRSIAGIPVPKRPLRSWAMAPLATDLCRLSDPHGRTGTIPLHPLRTTEALRAWLQDIARSARAWRRAEPGSVQT